MATLPIHKYFIFNDEVKETECFGDNEGGIYEVLRVKNGIPLFLENHLQRFEKSAEIAQQKIPYSEKQIEKLLNILIETNRVSEGNILISYETNMKAFFIAHSYPTEEMYKNGVVCGILDAERENPNAKVFQAAIRQKANEMIEKNGVYEVLLSDADGCITEGSRSNIFFVSGEKIVTAPGSKVLLGITRQKAVKLAEMLNIDVVEKEISINELQNFNAAFLTGTSPKILPVKQIDRFTFNVSETILRKIMNAYDALIEQYISGKKMA
jgi:branched-chain amino acid aminotransferase